MGSPLVDDIIWTCDICHGIISKEDLFRPNPNKYTAYHEECVFMEWYE